MRIQLTISQMEECISLGQELVNEDSVNHISDGGLELPGQETVNEDEDSSDVPQDGGVRRGKRNRTPREMYVSSMQGKMYVKGKYKWGWLPHDEEKINQGGVN